MLVCYLYKEFISSDIYRWPPVLNINAFCVEEGYIIYSEKLVY